jgi:hypothetical protein
MESALLVEEPAAAGRYSGSAWRSRFLRAPKVALELASRADFVPLSELATVKLGLKTGADDFFFLERISDESDVGELVKARGLMVVKGQNGWRGQVAHADMIPAVLNPHQLYNGEFRFLTVPKVARHFYLNPRPGKLRSGLPEYIRLAELHGTHSAPLVQSNGSEQGWYHQVRSMVTSPWVLPYNSAYDYGAWSNPNGHVLNGRFIGADPLDTDHSLLLGAVLNSTFAATGRLIEGVATGVEGAFDVGPPAARKIMVPDIRRMAGTGRAAVEAAFREIERTDVMPPLPLRDSTVPPLRRRLDTALLMALGQTAGQAAVVLDRLYTNYARWRANVEDVEGQMRANRRQMSASGVKRDQNPADVASRRVWEEIKHRLPVFPKAFLSSEETLELVNIPAAAAIPTTKPLFDVGVIRTKTRAIDLGSYERVRYVAMLRVLGVVGNVEVPLSATRAAAVVDLFEREQANFSNIAEEAAARYVSSKEAMKIVTDKARLHWHKECRNSALQKPEQTATKKKMN